MSLIRTKPGHSKVTLQQNHRFQVVVVVEVVVDVVRAMAVIVSQRFK